MTRVVDIMSCVAPVVWIFSAFVSLAGYQLMARTEDLCLVLCRLSIGDIGYLTTFCKAQTGAQRFGDPVSRCHRAGWGRLA